jgi:ATP-dependent DNA helicase DinG
VYSGASFNEETNVMDVDEIFQQGGALSRCLPGFEPRKEQLEMARAVSSSLLGNTYDTAGHPPRVLAIEAETGIGKTMAYLIPAVLSQKKIVISTATLNLQDQIVDKDLPLVERIIGSRVDAVCVKGRENYLCLYRWYQFRSTPQLSLLDDPAIEKIDHWLKKTSVGDRAELSWMNEKSVFWSKISARSSQCLGGDCPENAYCFVSRMRKRAGSAQLLIVNHHLFFSDISLRRNGHGEVLPRYEAVIFDEAHHLENVATLFFGKSFSQYQVLDLLSDIEQQARLDLPSGEIELLRSSLQGLRKRVESFTDIFTEKSGRYHLKPFIEEFSLNDWREIVELFLTSLTRVTAGLEGYTKYGEGWNGYIKRGEELAGTLREIAFHEDDSENSYVRWYEKRERSVALSATPVEVSGELIKHLYSNVEVCIMTSATLSTGGSFSYMRDRLGLDESTEFFQFSSPFDYQKRSLIYIPESSFPEPNGENYHQLLGERLLDILYASQGRALVLCTSFRGMDELADVLIEKLDYPVLVQGSQSKKALLARFRDETHSVLVAVASFWEGVDVVGESLSCVVIDKLPFEVPTDPVLQARIEQIKKNGSNPFFSFQVPRAIITLRQGVGRLMRSVTDRGVIAIMDVRLFTKGYGRTFIKSLPPAPVSRNMDDIDAFFRDADKS